MRKKLNSSHRHFENIESIKKLLMHTYNNNINFVKYYGILYSSILYYYILSGLKLMQGIGERQSEAQMFTQRIYFKWP